MKINLNTKIDIAEYYYSVISKSKQYSKKERSVSARIWEPVYEEMRTILGVPAGYSKHFRNGDDLSENLYRISKSRPIRFGHTKLRAHQYWEDTSVIENYIEHLLYMARTFGMPDKVFLPNIVSKNGLGGCVILDFEKK